MIRLSGPGGAASDYEVATLAQAKAYLQLTSATDDTLLNMIVDGTNQAIYRETGRMLKRGAVDFDDVVDGPGTGSLFLPEYPVSSLTSVDNVQMTGNNTFTTLYAYAATDFQLEPKGGRLILIRLPGVWPAYAHSIRLKYKAGYATLPPDLVAAACQWIAVQYQRVKAKRLDVLTLTTADQSLSFSVDDMPAAARRVISGFRRAEVGLV